MFSRSPLSFQPFPRLLTQRLQLRQLSVADKRAIFAIRSDKRVGQYLSRPRDRQIEQSSKFIEKINGGILRGEWIYWGLTLAPEDRVIGTICLWNIDPGQQCAEIGYELHPDFQGRGLMQEAIEAVLDYGFKQMNLQIVEAYLHAENLRSIRLLERNHFQFSRKVPPESKFEAEDHMEMLIYTRIRQIFGMTRMDD